MLLLLLWRFSRIQLCVTPQTAAHQAPPSLGFSRQECWSGLPLLSPIKPYESHKLVLKDSYVISVCTEKAEKIEFIDFDTENLETIFDL